MAQDRDGGSIEVRFTHVNTPRRLRLAILTPVMAPYRIPVFNAIAADPEIDLRVVYLAKTVPRRNWGFHEDEMHYRYDVLKDLIRFPRGEIMWSHLSRGLGRVLREHSPEVVIAGGWDQPTHLLAFALRKRLHYSFGWWIESTLADEYTPRGLIARFKERLIARSDVVVVPGSASEEYIRKYAAPRLGIFVAPNAVDNEFFQRRGASRRSEGDGTTRFLFVGRFDESKGLDALIDAWPRGRSDISLTMIGDGPLLGQVEQRIVRENLRDVISIRGHQDREALADSYSQADVLVLPSLREPWGLVINEAMAAGLPVIASSAAGGTRDLVEHGISGLIIPPGDVDALRNAVLRLADDPDARSRMAAAAASRIDLFSPERCAAGLIEAARACAA